MSWTMLTGPIPAMFFSLFFFPSVDTVLAIFCCSKEFVSEEFTEVLTSIYSHSLEESPFIFVLGPWQVASGEGLEESPFVFILVCSFSLFLCFLEIGYLVFKN
jgi:hypothetical protein